MAPRLAALLAALVSAAACASSGGGGAGGSGAPALSLAYDPAQPDQLTLTWTQPGDATGYTLEGRLLPGAWEVMKANLPPSQIGVVVGLDPALPELSDLEFRVTALLGKTSAASNVVPHHRSLRPPSSLVAFAGANGFSVQWLNHSLAADAWVLERRAVQLDGASGPWATLPVGFPAESYADADLSAFADGAKYEYRLAAAKGAERSSPISAATSAAPLLAPEFLSVGTLAGGVRLGFRNRSAYATEILITRTSAADYTLWGSALVAASATTHDDMAPAPGLYVYRLAARRPDPTGGPVESLPVERRAITGPPATWGMGASLATLIPGEAVARAPDGSFAAAGGLGGYPFGFTWHVAAGAPPAELVSEATGSRAFGPGVLVDAAGSTHTVFCDGPADWTNPVPVVHAWKDGTGWHREAIGSRVLSPGDATQVVRFALGADGTLHASWQAGPDPALGLEVASRGSSGTWTMENVSLALGTPGHVRWKDHFLAGDADGRPHVIVADWDNSLKHLWRGPAGWSLETVPTGQAADVLWGDTTAFAFLSAADRVAIVYTDLATYPAVPAIHLQERTVVGWGARQDLPAPPGGGTTFAAALSPDGKRLAVASKGYQGARVHVREEAGFTELQFVATPGGLATGFGATGKVWVLDGILGSGTAPAAAVDLPLFEEN